MSRIYLIGYRCTGKTTVGPIVAARLGWKFVDADEELEREAGQTIQQIFAAEGEAGFRDREQANLQRLAQVPKCVIATGGGIVLREPNREHLRGTGLVAWLTASPALIWQRMQDDPTTAQRRPALAQGGLAEVEELLARREPLYRETAHTIVDAEARSPETIAAAILAAWETGSTKFLRRSPQSSG
jgi:shikimate kinase